MFQPINLAALMKSSLITLNLMRLLMTGAGCATSASRLDFDPEMLRIWLIYPVISMRDDLTLEISRNRLLGDEYSADDVAAHSPDQNVQAGMPPVFLLHSADDVSVPAGNSLEMFAALRAVDVPAEMHIYADGGHGFGLCCTKGKSVEVWPEVLYSWIRFQTEAKSP